MHVIHLPYLHLFWCTVFPWFIGNLRLLNIFSNVFIRLINLHFSPQILWNPHSILVSCTPILCFDHVYYPIFFLQGVWNPPSIWWLIRYLICHRILSQINWDCLIYIFNIHICCCLVILFNQDLPSLGCITGGIGVLPCEYVLLCDCTTITLVVYSLTYDQRFLSFAIYLIIHILYDDIIKLPISCAIL